MNRGSKFCLFTKSENLYLYFSSQYFLLAICKRFLTLFEESGGSYLKLESREAFERFKDDDTGMFSFQLAWKLANDDCSVVVLEWLQGIGRKISHSTPTLSERNFISQKQQMRILI